MLRRFLHYDEFFSVVYNSEYSTRRLHLFLVRFLRYINIWLQEQVYVVYELESLFFLRVLFIFWMFKVLASQKRLENKYKAAQQASDEWYRKAQLALGRGDEDLAREALKRRKSYAVGIFRMLVTFFIDSANSLKAQLDQQKTVVDNLVSNTKLLESKIQEARSKKDTLKARAQSAKTATKVSEMLGNVNTSSALSAFEKMEEKVLAMESQAEALNQLTTDDLEGKFALLESSSVDDDLATLKKELSGRSMKGELPAGRTAASSSNVSSAFGDMDIERELNELRKKANEY
ncbi:hypothetical protein ZIOFF_001076 [Zingiber officinale]|uniref:Membrane-associated 30 kDa protein n=1 Tax=Zingiber officinale TaxID=94328 RepID=A0A8J5I5E5_ZINOF|nr:hypothetical protein ZIOFF_001076 [Zingiber officinale]